MITDDTPHSLTNASCSRATGKFVAVVGAVAG